MNNNYIRGIFYSFFLILKTSTTQYYECKMRSCEIAVMVMILKFKCNVYKFWLTRCGKIHMILFGGAEVQANAIMCQKWLHRIYVMQENSGMCGIRYGNYENNFYTTHTINCSCNH